MKPANAPVSATELSMEYGCQRKWAGKYMTDDPRWKVPTLGTGTGKEVHRRAQLYSEHGIIDRNPDPIGDMWLNALKHCAHPKTHWSVERKVHIDLYGIPFELSMDWYGPSDALPAAPPSMRAIADYKTSKDPKQYGVLGEAMKLADFQSVIYSSVGFGDQPGVFRHIYIRKTSQVLIQEASGDPELEAKARKQPLSQLSFPDDAVMHPERVRAAMERMVMPVAERVYTLRTKRGSHSIDPLTFSPNGAECPKYGGCSHRRSGMCVLTPAELLAGATGVRVMPNSGFDLFGRLPINGPAQTPAPAPAAAPVPFAFAMPSAAPAPAPEELPPGYTQNANPEFVTNPHGASEPKAQVLAAYAAWKAQQAAGATQATGVATMVAPAAAVAPAGLPALSPAPALQPLPASTPGIASSPNMPSASAANAQPPLTDAELLQLRALLGAIRAK